MSINSPILVSIIVNNFNYRRFLKRCIDSALQQEYRPIEVIVVDDGSQDGSTEVMSEYGGLIQQVSKENGGQASALNAGFARSTGDVTIFLDADDELLPQIAAQVVEAFQTHPEVVKVQYRLAIIDANGTRTGELIPPHQKSMPSGDLSSQVLTFPDDICWQPTSGNALRSDVLRRLFPIPEEAYRLCADYYLSNLTPLFGAVLSLDTIGGCYRVHGANLHHTTHANVAHSRQIITQTNHTHGHIKRWADSLGLAFTKSKRVDFQSVTYLAHRLVSLKLEPERHPISDDNLTNLFIRGVRAAFGRYDRSWLVRLIYASWFAAVALAPNPLVRRLAKKFIH